MAELITSHRSTKFMHKRKCDPCNTTVYGFSDRAAAELLEEHMEDRHPRANSPKSREDLQLADKDRTASQSFNIFSCVTTCGTLAAKTKSGGVFSYQLVTVDALGVP